MTAVRENVTGGVALYASPTNRQTVNSSHGNGERMNWAALVGCLIRARLRPSVETPTPVSTSTPTGAEANSAPSATTPHTKPWMRESSTSGLTCVSSHLTPKNTITPIATPTHCAIGVSAPTKRVAPSATSADSTMMLKPAITRTAGSPSGASASGLGASAGSRCVLSSLRDWTRSAAPCTRPNGSRRERAATAPARFGLATGVPPRPAASLDVRLAVGGRIGDAVLADDVVPVLAVDVPFPPRGEIRQRAARREHGGHQQRRAQAVPEQLPGAERPGRGSGGQTRRGELDEVDDPADHEHVREQADRSRDELENRLQLTARRQPSETIAERHGYGRGRLCPHSARRTRSALPLQILAASASPYRTRRWAWSAAILL